MKEVMVHIYRKIKQISSPFFRSCCLVTFKKSRGHLPLVTFGYYQDGRSLISSFSRSSKMAAMSNSRPWGRHAQSISRGLNIDRCIKGCFDKKRIKDLGWFAKTEMVGCCKLLLYANESRDDCAVYFRR